MRPGQQRQRERDDRQNDDESDFLRTDQLSSESAHGSETNMRSS